MKVIGKVDSVWRYPVKSMRGEELEEGFVGFAGVYGDRLFAIKSSACASGFPYLTAREHEAMLLYVPRFRFPSKAAKPSNLSEAEAVDPGVMPVVGDWADLIVDVETPSGESFAVDDPALIAKLQEGLGNKHVLSLLRSDRALADCRPVSLFGIQTARRLGEELGVNVDKRRFRSNIYMDLEARAGFAEDEFVGRTLRIGSKTVLSILERDPRCKMITLDPDTAEVNSKVLRQVYQGHDGMAGIYGAVLVEGTVRRGDDVALAD